MKPETLSSTFVLLLTLCIPAAAFVPTPVPEPATMLVVGGGVAAVILIARHRRNRGQK